LEIEDIERNKLIKKLDSMGVIDIKGKDPSTMPIKELKGFVEFLEKRFNNK
jgi:hypothetical protein